MATLAPQLACGSAAIATVLEVHVPQPVISFLLSAGCRVLALEPRVRFADVSPTLKRLGVDVDAWPVPPAGLTVVAERTIYCRETTPMTVVHETGHLLDLALGGGVYWSGLDSTFRSTYANARAFVTPYAATALDEYFAEAFRAQCEANDAKSPWPRATLASLRASDTALADLMARIVANPAAFVVEAAEGGGSC